MTSMMMFILLMMLMTKNSPMKSSLLVVFLSILCALSAYNSWKSMFSLSVIIISFSSGMMVLFMYCASTFNYENTVKKNKPKMTLLWVVFISLLTPYNMNNLQENMEKSSDYMNSLNMILLMLILMLSMTSINKVMFNPSKKMMKFY